jgi:hypothetical protein
MQARAQCDVAGDHKVVADMIASTIHKEQNMRPRILLSQSVQEDLKAFRICCQHDQEHTRPVFGTYRSIQVGELSNELAGDLGSYRLGSNTVEGGSSDRIELHQKT